ncbi:hypothetical protein KCU64_g18568, partial [Aureobasidium melanogenum]
LLAASSAIYFYHVPGDANYDIVSTFELWHEPSSLPSPWTWMEQDDVSDAASCAEQVENLPEEPYRSETCRLSNHSTAVEPCPLLPGKTTDNDTYVHNQGLAPAVYPTSLKTVDCVYLDANLRQTFTHGSRVFFPKKPGTFVAHFLQPVADQVALYHNVITRPLRCELRTLYQSFAKTIFDSRPSHGSQYASQNGETSETAWTAWQTGTRHSFVPEDHVRSTALPKEGCNVGHQDKKTKRKRTWSFDTEPSLEATVPSDGSMESGEFDDGSTNPDAPTDVSVVGEGFISELRRKGLATDRARNLIL